MEFMGERCVVTFVACVGEDAADAGTGEGLNVRKDGFERVAVPRVKPEGRLPVFLAASWRGWRTGRPCSG